MTKTQNVPTSKPDHRTIELSRQSGPSKGTLASVEAKQCGNHVRVTISGCTAHSFRGFFPGTDVDGLFEEFVTEMTNDGWVGEER